MACERTGAPTLYGDSQGETRCGEELQGRLHCTGGHRCTVTETTRSLREC